MNMRSVRMAPALAVIVGLAACAPPPPPDTSAADLAAVNAVREAWVAAYNAADADGLAGLYTEDAIDMPADEPTVTGQAGIRERAATQFAMGKATVTVTADETRLMGDWAFDRGSYSVTVVPAAGGDPMTVDGRYVVILRRQADGSWKLVRGMDNTPTPRAMPGGGN
jgi:uncharacterized protein (TIGR02246 family)